MFYENFIRTFLDTQAVGCNHVAEAVLNEGSRPALGSSLLPQEEAEAVGGRFVICPNCTDAVAVYFLDTKQVLHHIAQCALCNRNLCAKMGKISPKQKAILPVGSQFTCDMAHFPSPSPPPPPPPPHWIRPGQSRPPTYECCSKEHPTFGCDWTGVNDSFIDATGALPDVVPYTRKTYGGWPGDPSWMAAGCEIPFQAWKANGDLPSLVTAYPECKALVEFMVRHVNPDVGLAEFGYCKRLTMLCRSSRRGWLHFVDSVLLRHAHNRSCNAALASDGDWCAVRGTPKPATSSFSFMLSVSRLVNMASALLHADAIPGIHADVAHYNTSLAAYRAAWHKKFYSTTACSAAPSPDDATGCALGGKAVPACSCEGKLAAVAMECEPEGHAVPPPTCGKQNNTRLVLACKPGTGTIKKIDFAGYGDLSGSCSTSFHVTSVGGIPACHSAATQAIVEAACVGQSSCQLDASVGAVAKGIDPCPGKGKVLAVMAAGCEPAPLPAPPTPPPPPPSPPAKGWYDKTIAWASPRSLALVMKPDVCLHALLLVQRHDIICSYATDTQTGNAMALYLDIPPTATIKAETVKALIADFHAARDHPTFGTVGARIFLPVLAANNQMGVALDFATKQTQPSYGYMVSTDEMPGTIWEQWGGDAHKSAGSKNHPVRSGPYIHVCFSAPCLHSASQSDRSVCG
eukprot:SAG22_NODE_229_length_14598_cov_13.257052_4_plen_687_part_00